MYLLRGTSYIYQGEEIGMTNAYMDDIAQYRDVESLNFYKIMTSQGKTSKEAIKVLQERSRDNSRTPMQWSDEQHAGFTTGEPWLGMNPNACHINVKHASMQQNSLLSWYKELILVRKNKKAVSVGEIEEVLIDNRDVLAFRRKHGPQEIIVIANFFGHDLEMVSVEDFSSYACIMSNYAKSATFLQKCALLRMKPYEVVVLEKRS